MDTLRLFHDIARCHSFSLAAPKHGITQSAASQRISQLEKRLGVTLINRSVRPLALTDSGKIFYEGCSDLIDRYDRLQHKLVMMSDDPDGEVRIAAIYSSGIELLDAACEQFETDHPKITAHIDYLQPDEVYRRVLEGECDLGLVSYPQRWRKVHIVPLREEPMAVVCHPGHPLSQCKTVEASALQAYPMAAFDVNLPVGRRIARYLREQGVYPAVPLSFDNLDTIKNAVSVTDRFAILPARTVRREEASGTLAIVELVPKLTRPIGIIHRGRRQGDRPDGSSHSPTTLSLAVQFFLDFLIAHASVGSESHAPDAPLKPEPRSEAHPPPGATRS